MIIMKITKKQNKIVILDGATIGKDIDLSQIENFGEVIFYETSNCEQTIDRIKNADIVITNKVVIGKKELNACSKLKLICVAATGYNVIDIEACNKNNIAVTNVKGYSTESVAQLVFANLLSIQNSVFQYHQEINNGEWQKSKVFNMLSNPIHELKGTKMGIIGYGSIGKRVGELAQAFGMELLIAKRKNVDYEDNFRIHIDNVISQSDVLTIHIPFNSSTENLISENELCSMKSNSILVNMARGGIVNENDLYKALKNRQIKAAIIDVLKEEPPHTKNPLFELENIIITPHIAWTSVEARKQLVAGIVNNINEFVNGNIENIRLR